jgi:hypothetical protein
MQQNLVSNSLDNISEQINKAQYGSHYLLIYPDMKTLREIYSRYVKTQLEDNNEIVLILTYYEPPDNIRKILSDGFDTGKKEEHIAIRKYEDEASLIIMDSLKVYFGLDSGDGGSNNNLLLRPDKDRIITFLEQLVEKAKSLGKNGVSVFADLGSFYHSSISCNGINWPDAVAENLVEYELSLPSKFNNMNLKGFCIYHRADFDKGLTEEQRQKLLNHHVKRLIVSKSAE